MKLFLVHMKLSLLEFLRYPGYVISTLIFPSLFFVVFAAPNVEDAEMAAQFTMSFAGYAVLGEVFYQFTIAIVNSRATQWEVLVRTLPVSALVRNACRVVIALVISILAATVVMIVAKYQTPFEVSSDILIKIYVALLLGCIPFALMAIALGYLLNPQSALPITNMIYLIMSFTGGLWLPPESLPKFVQNISQFLPTRHFGEILWSVVKGESPKTNSVLILSLYTFVFLTLAIVLNRRFESKNYK